jgi:glycosyltransferase involved in cell wall biosynthesis
MVVLEGMSSGVPVVASRNSGFQRLVESGRQGLLIDPPDGEREFAAALGLLLDDTELAGRMGAAGRRRALRMYSWPVVIDQVEELYERLLGAGNGRARASASVVARP